jgi:hypothetical protein
MSASRRGRPSRFAEYDQLVASLPAAMGKRPKYLNGIGVFRGSRGITAWLKIRLPNGGTLKGKTYPPSVSVEIKVGSLDSWSWDQLTHKRRELQGKADRGEPLEEVPDLIFAIFATDWLTRAESRLRAHDTAHIHVHKHLIPAFGPIPLRRISLAHVNQWIARVLKGACQRRSEYASAAGGKMHHGRM